MRVSEVAVMVFLLLYLASSTVGLTSAGSLILAENDVVQRDGKYFLAESDQPASGLLETLDAEGRLAKREELKNGAVDGVVIWFYLSDQVRLRGTRVGGEWEGHYEVFWPSGKLRVRGSYSGGLLTGPDQMKFSSRTGL